MRRLPLMICLLALAVLCTASLASAADAKIRVLQITGDDVAPFHDWRDISDATRDVLEDGDRFEVTVCEDPYILESAAALQNYDVIVFLAFTKKLPPLTDAGKKNLVDFVEGGKGFYVQHLGSASYKDWDVFGELCGRKWVMGTSGHDPRGVFEVAMTKTEHPITKGVEKFKIFDELYSKLQGDAEITVLASSYSSWSEQEEPLVFVRDYGKGRCVHNALGHDYKAIENPGCATLIRRGVEWAATGDVKE